MHEAQILFSGRCSLSQQRALSKVSLGLRLGLRALLLCQWRLEIYPLLRKTSAKFMCVKLVSDPKVPHERPLLTVLSQEADCGICHRRERLPPCPSEARDSPLCRRSMRRQEKELEGLHVGRACGIIRSVRKSSLFTMLSPTSCCFISTL